METRSIERTTRLRKGDLCPALADPRIGSMSFLNEVTLRYPAAISFAPGRPYDGFFDSEQVFDYIRRFLEHLTEQGRSPAEVRDFLFQYGPAAGRIRDLVAESLAVDEDIQVSPESIVVTVGGQEAMVLVLGLFGRPEDVLLVSSPCYVGITGAAQMLGIQVVSVPEGPDGVVGADLEAAVNEQRALGRRVRALYVVPDHSNPSGRTLSLAGRRQLLELAARQDFLILEDSPYRVVSPGERIPLLKALDTERRVVHLGSYSKTVFPGARVGFVVADQEVVDDATGAVGLLAAELATVKSMITVNTPSLSQAVVAGALLSCGGRLSELNAANAAYYGDAMEFTLSRLEHEFPAARRAKLGVAWYPPSGGFFLALDVPFVADNDALRRSAVEHGVIWTPMSYFYPEGGGERCIRLSTSYLSHAEIEEGAARLAAFVAAESGRS